MFDINWLSDCCLTPTEQFFSYIMASEINWNSPAGKTIIWNQPCGPDKKKLEWTSKPIAGTLKVVSDK